MSDETNPVLVNVDDVQLRQHQEALLANQLLLQSINSKMQNVESFLVSKQKKLL